MPTIELRVDKANVWEEVAKTSAYTGDKREATEDGAYDRILMTDEAEKDLQRFWEEAAAVANEQLKEMLEEASGLSDDYKVRLEVSRSYDTVLNESIEEALRGYFISAIVGRWYKLANKEEAESYIADATNMIEDAMHKLYSRKRPSRPKREWEIPEE